VRGENCQLKCGAPSECGRRPATAATWRQGPVGGHDLRAAGGARRALLRRVPRCASWAFTPPVPGTGRSASPSNRQYQMPGAGCLRLLRPPRIYVRSNTRWMGFFLGSMPGMGGLSITSNLDKKEMSTAIFLVLSSTGSEAKQ